MKSTAFYYRMSEETEGMIECVDQCSNEVYFAMDMDMVSDLLEYVGTMITDAYGRIS